MRSSLIVVAALLGCSSEDTERPPLRGDDCGAVPCEGKTPGGGIGASGDQATGGQDGGLAAGIVQLAGQVRMVNQPDLVRSTALGANVVEIVGQDGDGARVSGGGTSGPFSIEVALQPLWLGARQLSGSQDLVSTLVFPAGVSENLSIGLVQRQVLEDLATEALRVTPVAAVDENLGHAKVEFVDAGGSPVVGLQVQSTGIVAYDLGDTYADSNGETSDRGSVVIFNVPAQAFPGAPQQVEVRKGAKRESVWLSFAKDTILFTTVTLEDF